ncbi:MAG TPA: alpha/beta hydrolase [Ktedonosporobacter sp.]|nr:alpha/beta hydrolase [Ktedonosporobacter sp.]
MFDDTTNEYASSVPYYEYSSIAQQPTGANTANMPAVSPAGAVRREGSMPLAGAEGLPLVVGNRRSHDKLLYSIIGLLSAILVIVVGSTALLLSIHPASSSTIKLNSIAWHTTSESTMGQFHYAACPFVPGSGIIEGQQVRCGVLAVPEDRSRPQGMMEQLAVAIFKSPAVNAAPDPEIYLQGGPGGPTLDGLGRYITQANLDTVTLGHDLILLDQRGTGYSKPALGCPELYRSQNNNSPSTGSQDPQVSFIQAIRACHDRLVQSGVNLNKYTTIDNATDVHDLIHALGYKQINLYGVSYGTRLALTVMRLFPEDLRSVILDSTVPTQNNLFKDESAVTQHAFDVLFHGCAVDSHCNTAYPQLQSTFYTLITKLNDNPASFRLPGYDVVVRLDGNRLVEWLFRALYDTRLIPKLPETIAQINNGNYDLIAQSFVPVLSSRGLSDGMYFSVECGEDMAYTSMQELTQSTSVLRPEIRPDIQAGLQSIVAICQNWGEQAVPVEQKQPVTSSLPTLILSGEYDPITPTTNAKRAMQTLSNSSLFIFPATGHGVFHTNSCPDSIMAAFMVNPSVKPDGTCIATMAEPVFQ